MQMWMAQLRKGLVELCVMAALQDDETYGYEIFQRPDGPRWLAMPEGVVYQVLRRLARDGFVRKRGGQVAHWTPTALLQADGFRPRAVAGDEASLAADGRCCQ